MSVAPVSAKTNDNGVLEIGGIALDKLASKYQTPLYVLDVETIKNTISNYFTFQDYYPKTKIAYASKALSMISLYQLLDKKSVCFDVVSAGELHTLVSAGVSAKKAYFHGNNKSKEELMMAISLNVGTIVVDNMYELGLIKSIIEASPPASSLSIMIRIIPEIEAHTHEFIKTGQRDTKFGVPQEELMDIIDAVVSCKGLNLTGLHAHIGSQIFDIDPFLFEVEKLLNLYQEIYKVKGLLFDEINIGGGVGIPYTNEDDPPDIHLFVQEISKKIKSYLSKIEYPHEPTLVLEPGRSIIANAGVTIYTVGSVKTIPGATTYVAVDGGMADNARVITYGAEYEADVATKMTARKDQQVCVAGKFCESGDILLKNVALQSPATGDLIVVYGTGAYNYSMSSNYNRFMKPAMVMVYDGQDHLAIKRETLDDIVRNDQEIDVSQFN